MVTVPTPRLIQRNSKKVSTLQPLQHLLAVCSFRNGVAQRTAQAVEDGGVQQESSCVLGLAPEDLFGQIVQDITAATPERCDEVRDIFASSHGQCCKLQSRDPTFGTLDRKSVV